jgi:iron complex transport system substrate-binding protein
LPIAGTHRRLGGTFAILFGVLALGIAACGGGEPDGAPEEEGTFTGADGVVSEVSDTSRVVSLSGDLTEFFFALGHGESVVGVDVTTVEPAAATELPNVGVGRFLAAESVLAQEPTLVVGDTQTAPLAAIEQIRAAGVPVVIFDIPTTFEGLYNKVGRIGELLGSEEEAAELADRMRGEVETAMAVAADADDTPRMAYVYTRGPDVMLLFGGEMVTRPLIEAANGIDVGTESGIETTVSVTAEGIIDAAPEVIIVPAEGFEMLGGIEGLLEIPGFAETPAGHDGRVLAYPEGDFLTFGPRVAESLRQLIADVHGL